MPNIVVLMQPGLRETLFPPESLSRLKELGDVTLFEEERHPTPDDARSLLAEAEICIGSWGMPTMDDAVLKAAPQLKLIVYGAGSVKAFVTDAVWERRIRVTSGAGAIAVGVAEFVVGQAIMARREAFRLAAFMRGEPRPQAPVRELWGSTVGIVSMGLVGRLVADRMKPFGVTLLGYDPYVPEEVFESLGVQKVELNDLLERADVVTLHSPNLPETRRLIASGQLQRMKDDAVFINTSRGAVVNEADLIEELRKGRFFACLDVTDPEPPAPDSPLRSLPNVFLTPHIAGPRTQRLGMQAVEEVERYLAGQPPIYEMTKERLPFTG